MVRYYGALGPRSTVDPQHKAGGTIRRHIKNILTCDQHPVTNAMSEGLSSKIQKIKSTACGFRNTENFKTAIFFHCGGLQLYPCWTRKRRNSCFVFGRSEVAYRRASQSCISSLIWD